MFFFFFYTTDGTIKTTRGF